MFLMHPLLSKHSNLTNGFILGFKKVNVQPSYVGRRLMFPSRVIHSSPGMLSICGLSLESLVAPSVPTWMRSRRTTDMRGCVVLQGVVAVEVVEAAAWALAWAGLAARSRTGATGVFLGPRRAFPRPWTLGPTTGEQTTPGGERVGQRRRTLSALATGTTLRRAKTGARRTGRGNWRPRCSHPAGELPRPLLPRTRPASCSSSRRGPRISPHHRQHLSNSCSSSSISSNSP